MLATPSERPDTYVYMALYDSHIVKAHMTNFEELLRPQTVIPTGEPEIGEELADSLEHAFTVREAIELLRGRT